MKRLLLSGLFSLALISGLPAAELFFDFGDSAQPTAGNVSNLTKGGVSLLSITDAVDSTGAATAVDVSVSGFHAGNNGNGTLSPAGAASIFASQSTRDNFFGSTADFGGTTAPTGTVLFSGLDPSGATTYAFEIFASRTSVSDNREALYALAGQNTGSAVLDAANNTSAIATVTGMLPDATGTITLTVSPGPSNTNGSGFFYLGAIRLTTTGPGGPAPISFTQHPADLTVLQGTPATFTAAVGNEPPYTVQWLQDGNEIDGATALTHTIPSVDLGLEGARFSVRVSNTAHTGTSNPAVLHVTPDTVRPAAVSATTPNRAWISLLFSKTLDPSTATLPSGYTLLNQAATVREAILQPDGRTVLVGMDGLLTGAWTLSVSGVSDLFGNTVAAGTTFTGTAPSALEELLLIDFGDSARQTTTGAAPDDPANAWNNITATAGSVPGSMIDALTTVENVPTTAGVEILSRFSGANGNGTAASSLYPADAAGDSLFANTELFGELSNVTPSFKLYGLDPARAYSFSFFASRTGVPAGEIRSCLYSVTGDNSGTATLDAANNQTGTAEVAGILPDSNGAITISLSPAADNNNSNHFIYLGVLRVHSVPSAAPPRFTGVSVTDGILRLAWSGTGSLQWSETLAPGSWTTILPAPVSPWTTPVDPAKPRRFYRLAW